MRFWSLRIATVVGSILALALISRAITANIQDYVQLVLISSGIYVVLAVSLNLINGITGQFSIGHAGFFGIGAYVGASWSKIWQPMLVSHVPALQMGTAFGDALNLTIAMALAAMSAAIAGFLVGLPSLRLRGDYLAIVTLGFGEVIRVVLLNIEAVGGARGMTNIPALTSTGGLSFFWVYLVVVAVIALSRNLCLSVRGLTWLAVREDEIAADAMGVNTTSVKVTAFVIGSAFAGIAGALYAHSFTGISPDAFGMDTSIIITTMVVLGGTGSITGATIAAILLTALPEQLRFLKDYRMVVFSSLLVVMMLTRPQGIFGHRELTWKTFGETPGAAAGRSGGRRIVSALLDVSNVTKRFGGLAAVSGLNIHVEPRELVGLIGPNGAGKTTAFNLLTGVYEPSEGAIQFDGRLINGMKPFQIARLQMARTFQNIRLFKNLTALENVKIASHLRTKASLPAAIFRTPGLLKNDAALDAESHSLLQRMDLEHVANSRANDLAYGLQRRLEIARALATRPKLLLLDEPAAGMNPQEKVQLMQLIRTIREEFDLTILLIEHDMKVVMGICQRIYVLDYGQIIAEGTPLEIRGNPKVIAAYLGQEAV